MVDLGKCVVRLETTQTHMIDTSVSLAKKQDDILTKLDDVHNTVNGKAKDPVTFKWILEKIALPLLLGGGSAAMALFAMAKVLGWA